MADWNANIISEFRENDGAVGGVFEGKPLLLLHHSGARTGTDRVSPLGYQAVEGGYAVFASKGGADSNPDWYYNLMANPDTKIEVGSEVIPVTARELTGEERATVWEPWKEFWPQFADYEAGTDRVIPVILLERRA